MCFENDSAGSLERRGVHYVKEKIGSELVNSFTQLRARNSRKNERYGCNPDLQLASRDTSIVPPYFLRSTSLCLNYNVKSKDSECVSE